MTTAKTSNRKLTPNQKLVLQTIRLNGSVSKAELARRTRLTAQAIGQIVTKLEARDLLLRETRVKGRVGQPTTPLSLNPDGAFAIGIKIGRRQTDWLLIDMVGAVRYRHSLHYDFPVAETLLPQIQKHLQQILVDLGPLSPRVVGVGVAAPFMLGGWHQILGLPQSQALNWNSMDIAQQVQQRTTLPVCFAKDTTAACMAELVQGHGKIMPDFLYLHVDTFVGGGVVLGGVIHYGKHGNAGAIASLPMNEASGTATQLLRYASLWELEQRYISQGLDPSASYDERALTKPFAKHTQAWLESAAKGLANAVISSIAVLDVNAVVIDGAMTQELLHRLITKTQMALDQFDWEGLWRPTLHASSIGTDAGAVGGALLPLHAQFEP